MTSESDGRSCSQAWQAAVEGFIRAPLPGGEGSIFRFPRGELPKRADSTRANARRFRCFILPARSRYDTLQSSCTAPGKTGSLCAALSSAQSCSGRALTKASLDLPRIFLSSPGRPSTGCPRTMSPPSSRRAIVIFGSRPGMGWRGSMEQGLSGLAWLMG
jgi:hypothetical protein